MCNVSCNGSRHSIGVTTTGKVVLMSHIQDRTAVAAASALGTPCRCLDVERRWARATNAVLSTGHRRSLARGLPPILERAAIYGVPRTVDWLSRRTPDALAQKRADHARAKVRDLTRRIKALQTRLHGWRRKVENYERGGK